MKCTECGKEISYLDVVEVTAKVGTFDGRSADVINTEVVQVTYTCPECHRSLFHGDQANENVEKAVNLAKKFLHGKGEEPARESDQS